MAELINLRQARKQKARAGKQREAEQNRAAYGRSKAEKLRDKSEAERTRKHLDGHRLEDSDK